MPRKTKGYIHGYSMQEQKRLLDQASFLKQFFYDYFDFSGSERILEVGCGVGAQTRILLNRFPHLVIDAIDNSRHQLSVAEKVLANDVKTGRVSLHHQRAEKLNFPSRHFDGAFLCWFLEHVADPVAILREIRRTMKPGGVIYCTEVHNASFYVHPPCVDMMRYWSAFNEQQLKMQGDPNVGSKLGSLLKQAGFTKIQVDSKTLLFDDRDRKLRREFLDYWETLLLSAAPCLTSSGAIPRNLVRKMRSEISRFKKLRNSVFLYTPFQASARAV